MLDHIEVGSQERNAPIRHISAAQTPIPGDELTAGLRKSKRSGFQPPLLYLQSHAETHAHPQPT
jgi:hypothetical protein